MTFRCANTGVCPLLFLVLASVGMELPSAGQASTKVQPIETLWWIAAEALTERNAARVEAAIQQWQEARTFDAFSVGILPPTFYEPTLSVRLANRVHQKAPDRLVVGLFPTGLQGWETSFNQQFAERLAPLGVRYDPTRAMTCEQWLDSLPQIVAPELAYVLEQPVRKPTSAEVGASAKAFAQVARKKGKRVALWLSAMMLRQPKETEIVGHLWTAVGKQVDDVVWMDLPIVSQEPGQSLNSLLSLILSITPREKVLIQFTHNPHLLTKDPSGTLAYIATCQGLGINRFVLLANPSLLQQEPWQTFYRNLRKPDAQRLHAQSLLENTGFEETTSDADGTLDPLIWEVTEGKTNIGTAEVIEEHPELVRTVGAEQGVVPYEGNRMLKIDARLYLKTNVRQFYRYPITEGKLVQEIALYPYSEKYLQQLEIRGKRDPGIKGKKDAEKGVRGNQLFALKYSHEKVLLVVTTGAEWKRGRHLIWKEFPPLPHQKWSLVKVVLEKVSSTHDEWGRTTSRWKLILYLNGKLLYESGREGEPYVQYFQSADFIVMGDDYVLREGKPAENNRLGPTTGDSFGVVYVDAAEAFPR